MLCIRRMFQSNVIMDTHLPVSRNNKEMSFKHNKFVVKLGLYSQKLKELSDTFYFL